MHRYQVSTDVPRENESQYNLFSERIAKRRAQSYAAAALLAIDHFNNRVTTVVPEIASIDEECSVHFSRPIFVDSEATSESTVAAVFQVLNDNERERPCAVLAPLLKESGFDVLPAVDAFDIPLLSYFNEEDAIVSQPGKVGVTLSPHGRAHAMTTYDLLRNRGFLSVWHQDNEQETALAKAIAAFGGETVQTTPLPGSLNNGV